MQHYAEYRKPVSALKVLNLQLQLALSKYNKILRIRSGANCKLQIRRGCTQADDFKWPALVCVYVRQCVCAHNVSLIDTFRKATALTNWMSLGQLGKLPGTGKGGRTQAISLSLLNSLIQVGAMQGEREREGGRKEGRGAWQR